VRDDAVLEVLSDLVVELETLFEAAERQKLSAYVLLLFCSK